MCVSVYFLFPLLLRLLLLRGSVFFSAYNNGERRGTRCHEPTHTHTQIFFSLKLKNQWIMESEATVHDEKLQGVSFALTPTHTRARTHTHTHTRAQTIKNTSLYRARITHKLTFERWGRGELETFFFLSRDQKFKKKTTYRR